MQQCPTLHRLQGLTLRKGTPLRVRPLMILKPAQKSSCQGPLQSLAMMLGRKRFMGSCCFRRVFKSSKDSCTQMTVPTASPHFQSDQTSFAQHCHEMHDTESTGGFLTH